MFAVAQGGQLCSALEGKLGGLLVDHVQRLQPGTAALLLSFELLVAKPGKPAIFGMLPAAKTRGIGWLRGIEGYKGFAHPIMDFDRIEVPFEGTNVDKALCSSFKPVAMACSQDCR
ncbi:hypothetical protein ADT71_01615 [Novosphingobium sp. ST904]|nr:hypothetical protein ADT71_01615 [Novosphingobium sp. ST904]